ncbi:alpha/beta hydrolase [Paracoccus sp. JM45]|uniref:alpha/beta hydrolase n=1 Tax=Paracoccus sp. JM45 TaxID=2283626 RepID=UPI000E6C8704|nr:alpha/beta hydrolase [Paracoccus sp. JM45]RJE78576.1 alpha/beta hydrolase [Paracoccus sp. JM45]
MIRILTLCALLLPMASMAETIIPLYPEGTFAPLPRPESQDMVEGEMFIFNISTPTLEVIRPTEGAANGTAANGTAVIVAPGGGFVGLAYEQSMAVAHRLADLGVTAFVLKYRTIESPDDGMHMPEVHIQEMNVLMQRAETGQPAQIPIFTGEPAAVEDGRRAMALLRKNAANLGIDPAKIGMLGFSSGAFMAADLAIGDAETRPDFVALLYGGLRTPVPATASPAFIAAAADDAFLPDDSLRIYAAWRHACVPAELHIYQNGGHGFGLTPQGKASDHWFEDFADWLHTKGLIRAERRRSSAAVECRKGRE